MKSYRVTTADMHRLGDKQETHFSLDPVGQSEDPLKTTLAEYIRNKKINEKSFFDLIENSEEELKSLSKHCKVAGGRRRKDLAAFFAALFSS